jgi:hypothetical protein
VHGRSDRGVTASQLECQVPGAWFVEQGGNDRGDVGAGTGGTVAEAGDQPREGETAQVLPKSG